MDYSLLKLIHILSSTVLFGTGLGTAFSMVMAHRSGRLEVIAYVSRAVVRADWFFTTPAVIVQPVSGFWLLSMIGRSWSESWVVVSLLLYVLVGCCWLPVVWLQVRMRNLAQQAFNVNTELDAQYHRYFRVWFTLGWPAFLSVTVIFYLMIAKPVIW